MFLGYYNRYISYEQVIRPSIIFSLSLYMKCKSQNFLGGSMGYV